MIFAFPNSIFRIIAFMTGKLYHEAFCREIRCDVDIKKHTVFLIRVLFNLHNLEAFDDGKSSVSCPLKPSDSAPLKHSTMPP